MDIRHIKYFIAVAEELHFGRAAERLNISQPPLSQQIRQLEKNMDVKLFNRSSRVVKLTDAGKIFLEDCYKIIHSLEKAKNTAREIHNGTLGNLVIGFTGSAIYNLVALLKVYQKKYPDINVHVYEMSATEQHKSLLEKRIDIGLITTPIIKNGELETKFIERHNFIVALPKNHRLANANQVLSVESLKNESLIVIPRNVSPIFYDLIMSIFYKKGVKPKIGLTAQVSIAVISLVAAGLGIAIVPSSIKQIPMDGVVFKEIDDSNTSIGIAITYNKDHISTVLKKFLETIDH